MINLRSISVLCVGLVLVGCAQFAPYRTAIPDPKAVDFQVLKCRVDDSQPILVDDNQAQLKLCEDPALFGSGGRQCTDAGSQNYAECQSVQQRFYQSGVDEKEKAKRRQKGDYYLSFVEFDDQGWFADRTQMQALFALLNKLEKDGKEVLIQVYAHGWKHNASPCDNNVVCFSRLLERTDLAEKQNKVMSFMFKGVPENATEQERAVIGMGNLMKLSEMDARTTERELGSVKPRTVVGVYLGWRGLPFDTFLNNASFWSRKDTAERVGRGGVFELLTRLRDYRDIRRSRAGYDAENDPDDANKTQLVITGHSFGGMVIYSALYHAMMERAAKIERAPGAAVEYDIARSFGDFVLLVNPAFEGTMYEPLFNIATNRCYQKLQRPVMMIATSKADSATRVAFPIGRAISTLNEHATSPEQRQSMLNTIGHEVRYKTHDLTLAKGDKTGDESDGSACGCPHLLPTSEVTLDTVLNGGIGSMLSNNYGKGLYLTPAAVDSRYATNYPFLVVTTDAEVIADHNAIYNNKFTTFTQQFLLKHIVFKQPLPAAPDSATCWRDASAPGSLVPYERSCQLSDGSACTKQSFAH